MFTDIIQQAVNGLMLGSVVALPALGLTLIFSVLGSINFSVAAQMTAGAYAGWMVNTYLGWPLVPCLIAAFVIAAGIGVAGDRIALAPLRKKASASTPLMVAVVSIALNLALENVFRFSFGNGLNSYNFEIARDIRIGDIRLGPQQFRNMVIALVITAGLAAFFNFTRIGKAMRGVADNPDLARLKGISPANLSTMATAIGMGLAGIGGALLAIDTSVDPLTGSRLLLVIFAAAVVGGLGSLGGAVAGALLVGLASELSLLAIPPVYQSGIAFVAIMLVLTVRPSGLFSAKTRV
ncbi:branched-chain amino acid ABC transporter permease [Achromobacter seleniivolatilans]|uniref:Branched-chain amino acid ABC transporter permease n=1 Tax=Achromobacter seleniivolatilans TaxID=3047478 RepID=A0ABY9M564_9BURK|nr:branched-chain amino acid ABC transporter permease [Achromobacter sp. R39]WMD22136.1 branched-chain amino acid ABC transporter permease [Achromobacter sp. R39]